MQVVTDLKLLGGRLDGRLVDNTIALEGMHIARPNSASRLHHR